RDAGARPRDLRGPRERQRRGRESRAARLPGPGIHRPAADAGDGLDRERRRTRAVRRQGRRRERNVLRGASDRQRACPGDGCPAHRIADDSRARLARITRRRAGSRSGGGCRGGAARAPPDVGLIGTAAKRVDTPEKATGRARFISDAVGPGMVHARLWRSPVPHARITAIDTSRARKASGVLAVLTAKDLPVKDLYYGPAFKDQPLLADGVIRHAGEPVVAIVAETIAQADAALPLVTVEWQELPVVDSLDAALAPGAPVLHDRARPAVHFRDLTSLKPIAGTNICHQYSYARGDLDRGFA